MSRIPFLSLILLSVTCIAGNPGADPASKMLAGESKNLGAGSVHAYVELDTNDLPTAVVVNFSAGMLNGLPMCVSPYVNLKPGKPQAIIQ